MSRLGLPMINRGKNPNKKCTICLEFKNRREFPPSSIKRSDYRCTKCSNKRAYKWRQNNPDRNRFNAFKGERKYLLKWYGVTPEWYENKLKEQNYCCGICGLYQLHINKKRLDVDHCHNTGKVRGLLCNRCNTGIGQLKDNEQIIINALAYIRRYSDGNAEVSNEA